MYWSVARSEGTVFVDRLPEAHLSEEIPEFYLGIGYGRLLPNLNLFIIHDHGPISFDAM
jgi:hypothetical protein